MVVVVGEIVCRRVEDECFIDSRLSLSACE
jgi:hypothetical protein